MGQLGTGDKIDSPLPKSIKIPFNSKIKQITGGGSHTIILSGYSFLTIDDGEIYISGKNFINIFQTDSENLSINSFRKISVPGKVFSVCCGWDSVVLLLGNVFFIFR